MKVYGFVGPSGTGKSYRAQMVASEKGINFIGGVDEVGRGPLIGPVVTACVVLPKDFVLEGLNDSKKLTEKKRDLFYQYIIAYLFTKPTQK